MNYTAQIAEINEVDEYEGSLIININNVNLKVAYQAPIEFANNIIRKNKELLIDLWLIYGSVKKVEPAKSVLATDLKIAGGKIKGTVTDIFSSNQLRLDCGLLIDIDSEQPLENIKKGDFLETEGTYQIYFPETKWDSVQLK